MSFVVPTSAAKVSVDVPVGLSAAVKSETSVKITGEAVKGAEKYIVYYSTEKKEGYQSYGKTTNTYATVKGLTTETKYYFRVRAVQTVDGKSIKSNYSKAVSATPKNKSNTNETATTKNDNKTSEENKIDPYWNQYEYWMNPKSMKVHKNSCRTLKHYENFIGTDNLKTALNEGYVRCKVCYPK